MAAWTEESAEVRWTLKVACAVLALVNAALLILAVDPTLLAVAGFWMATP